MQTERDCGPVAISNLVEALTGRPGALTYQEILANHGFPNKDNIWDDFWDSPSRHLEVIEKLTGQKAGLIPDHSLIPCVVLIRKGLFRYHWVTMVGTWHGRVMWHDGQISRTDDFQASIGTSQVVLAYTIGGVVPLPWYWSIWYVLTKLFV